MFAALARRHGGRLSRAQTVALLASVGMGEGGEQVELLWSEMGLAPDAHITQARAALGGAACAPGAAGSAHCAHRPPLTVHRDPHRISDADADARGRGAQESWERLMVQYMRRNAERQANMFVVAVSTPAQLFHVLRRQMNRPFLKCDVGSRSRVSPLWRMAWQRRRARRAAPAGRWCS